LIQTPQGEFDELLEIDIGKLGACNFATTQALFDLSGIVNGDKKNA